MFLLLLEGGRIRRLQSEEGRFLRRRWRKKKGNRGKNKARKLLTGPPLAPSCSLTLTMSMGWMMVVAAIPESPPLTKGLAVAQAPAVAGLESVIFFLREGGGGGALFFFFSREKSFVFHRFDATAKRGKNSRFVVSFLFPLSVI